MEAILDSEFLVATENLNLFSMYQLLKTLSDQSFDSGR